MKILDRKTTFAWALFLVSAVVTAAALPTTAQNPVPGQGSGTSGRTGTTGATGQSGSTQGSGDMDDTHRAMHAPRLLLGSKLLGTKVESATGEKLGDIQDAVIQPSGTVAYAVLEFGGALGLGEKYFALPWSTLDFRDREPTKNRGEYIVVLGVDKERLKNAPGFDKKNWPTMTTSDWSRDVDAYYAPDMRGMNRPVEAGAPVAGASWRLSELKGFNVENTNGDKLGDIKDTAIDVNGNVSYVVVSVGGFLGIGDRQIAVPWQALTPTRTGDKGDKRRITMATTKERLERAPVFKESRDNWNEMADPIWVGSVYQYYSVRPYWSTTSGTGTTGNTGGMDEHRKDGKDNKSGNEPKRP